MDQDHARGIMNQLFYPIDGAPDLSDATAVRLVDNMIDGRLFSSPVEDFAAAIDETLRAGSLHPQTAEMSQRYADAELLEFLHRVARELGTRRPWPRPRFTKRDVAEWAEFGDAAVIGQVNRPAHQITGALGYSFDQVPAGEGKLPVLVVQMRTGEVVALMGSVDPRSTMFTLLHRGEGDRDEVLAHFRELTGFNTNDVVPV
ncbi:hypothetical protein ACIA5D_50570 [Actinoplanes sp. NPDC051513]|uniref:hypothetical protein n=1 Tax=Actinoplanes sp. NPDC051513 TaxID=3363908 RepID=UPI0037A56BF8